MASALTRGCSSRVFRVLLITGFSALLRSRTAGQRGAPGACRVATVLVRFFGDFRVVKMVCSYLIYKILFLSKLMLQVFYLLNQSIWIDHLKLPVDGLQYV
jgi:hypothetical protein